MPSTHTLKQTWKWTSLLVGLILLVLWGGHDAQGKGGQRPEEVNTLEPLTLSNAAGGRKMYWTDRRGIKRADLNGTNMQDLINVVLNSPAGIALDVAAGKIYWIDSDTDKIQRANLDGTAVEDLVTTELINPRGIALDVVGGKMYWTDWGTNKIQRANLDGTDKEDLVITELINPRSIALNVTEGKMYWTDWGTNKIQRANLDGTAPEDLVTTGLIDPRGIALDEAGGKMYWTDVSTNKIQRANLDGTAPEDLVTGITGSSIALDVAAGKMYWTGSGKIRRANLDGTAMEDLVANAQSSPIDLTLDMVGGKIYWTDMGLNKIQRSNLDGTAIEDLVTTDLLDPRGLALDVAGGKMYWTDVGTNKIQRANLDGTAVQDLITELSYPMSIALDVTGGKMYWIASPKIRRANLDGTAVEDLVATGLTSPNNIALDVAGGKMYWTDGSLSPSNIRRANLDGIVVEDLVTTDLWVPHGIALDVAEGKMYWTDPYAILIRQANLDGTAAETLIAGLSGSSIALDVVEGKMYWTGSGKIQRANLDGTAVEDLVTDLLNPHTIALDLSGCFALTLAHFGSGSDPVASPANSSGCESGQYTAGETISLTANPSSGWHVASWNGTSNNTSTSTSNTVIMPASEHTVTVHYEEIPPPGDAFEPNNTCDQSGSITSDGVVQVHTFHDQEDTDWISFTATAATTYLIEAQVPPGSPADVVLELYDQCGSLPQDGQGHIFTPGVRLEFEVPANGPIYLQFTNDNAAYGEDVAYHLSVRELAAATTPGAVVIVGGRLKYNDPLQDNIDHITNRVYRLFTNHGYDSERIYYMATDLSLDADGDGTPDIDARPTQANLQAALTDWALDKVGPGRALTLYMIDHGNYDQLYLDNTQGEQVTPQQIDSWLTQLEAARPEVAVNVIVEACNAGSFIDLNQTVSNPNRVVITSTGAWNLAWASDEGAIFSDHFLDALEQEASLLNSFQSARWATQIASPSQTPWLDDDGDSNPNDLEDGTIAAQRGFAFPGTLPGPFAWPPYIVQAEPVQVEEGEGIIQAEVRDDQSVRDVWAIIYPPSYQPPQSGEELIQEPLPTIRLLPQGDDRYAAVYVGFDEVGIYDVVIFAEDYNNLAARPLAIEVSTGQQIFLPIVIQ